MPFCGAVAAPVVVMDMTCATDLQRLTSDKPPQNAILHLNAALQVVASDGGCIGSLSDILPMCNRSVPVLYFDSAETGDALAAFVDYHNLADAILCTPYDKRDVLATTYEKMPMLRGMLDLRDAHVPANELPAIAVAHCATAVILAVADADEDSVQSLQKRFIHVVTMDEAGFAQTAVSGVNGIITRDTDAAYDFLSRFPEGSMLRRRNLFAHKGFSGGGMYSENTITSVVAAGKHHMDGSEIDIKLTSDDVPVVMHNTNTIGLFDCEKLITEETDYATLASLRRIEFPDESIDRFEDLMHAMHAYPETPVLIELKPSTKYNNVEEMLRLIDPVLRSPESQQNCICIMGDMPPGHRYVHKHLPYLPQCYCEGSGAMPPPPQDRNAAEDCLYRIARLTCGCAAGYNAEDIGMNRLLNEYAKFRMITVFPWSRSWTLEPSKWEEHGPDNCATYLAGYDAWTTDHGEKFICLPMKIVPTDCAAVSGEFRPMCRKLYRDGREETGECELLVLDGDVRRNESGAYEVRSKATVMYRLQIDLYFGESYSIYSAPVEIGI